MYILKVYSIHFALWLNKNIFKNSIGHNKRYKKQLPFTFCEFQLITALFLICDFYKSWSTRFVSLKLCVGFPIFNSVSFLKKFIFLFKKYKSIDSLTLKRHNSFQNYNNRKAIHGLTPRPLTFKRQKKSFKGGLSGLR